MIVSFDRLSLTIPQILDGIPSQLVNDDHEVKVIELIENWFSGANSINYKTSGSTGKPKSIHLTKEQMIYSAEATMNHIDPQEMLNSAVLCINPAFIGGSMLIIRALIKELDLTVKAPNSIPDLPADGKALISLVPYQVMNCLDQAKNYFDGGHTLLIGGARLPEEYAEILRERKVDAYTTYGMTETASHIALRHIASTEALFKVIGDTQIDTDERDCLKICGTITGNKWLQTNDIVDVRGLETFKWMGRADLVINSGGFKIYPEPIEAILSDSLKKQVLVLPKEDAVLGQKAVLLIESDEDMQVDPAIFDQFHAYAKPKNIIFVKSFEYTVTGKIDRLKTAKKNLS